MKLAIEFDGPWHYMRKASGSTDRVGPTDARTHMRNELIRRTYIFDALLVIPFYEWDDVRKRNGPEGGYGEIDGVEATAQTLGMAYLKRKISELLIKQAAGVYTTTATMDSSCLANTSAETVTLQGDEDEDDDVDDIGGRASCLANTSIETVTSQDDDDDDETLSGRGRFEIEEGEVNVDSVTRSL